MPTFIVEFVQAGRVAASIEAEYYRHDGGWTTFKDVNNKAVHDIPDHLIKAIRRSAEAPPVGGSNVEVHVHGYDTSAQALRDIGRNPGLVTGYPKRRPKPHA